MNYVNIPKTVSFEGEKLVNIKNNLELYAEEAEFVKKHADKYLGEGIYSVVYKKLVPPSGDPHDYMTMGTYWWPDPSKPDGLPYIRRDGYVNPDAVDKKNTYKNMCQASYALAHAAYIFEREDYANAAVKILSAWHIDPETKMNPSAEYAQAIPGICSGRGIGLIDFSTSFKVFDATEILFALGVMDENTYSSIKNWYIEFINWMITSEIGIFEDNYFNNHGTWYDVQIISAAIFTSRPELAKRVASNAYRRRHKTQIEPDGKQPHELARTRAMMYSTMNLVGLTKLAKLAARVGYKDYFAPDKDTDTVLLKKAVEFLYPYAKDQAEFPYQQLDKADLGGDIIDVLTIIAEYCNDDNYITMAKAIYEPKYMSNIYPK